MPRLHTKLFWKILLCLTQYLFNNHFPSQEDDKNKKKHKHKKKEKEEAGAVAGEDKEKKKKKPRTKKTEVDELEDFLGGGAASSNRDDGDYEEL